MRQRYKVILVFVVAIAVAMFVRRREATPNRKLPRPVTVDQGAAGASRAPTAVAQTSATPPTSPYPLRKEQRMSAVFDATSHQRIDFYGRVIDQYGKPISGVTVTATVEAVTRFMQDHREQYSATTDANGRFAFVGLSGQNLSIYLAKPGCEYKSNLKRYGYSMLTPESERHRPAASAPVLFTMWKRKEPEPLVRVDLRRIPLPVDGTSVGVDMLGGRQLQQGGDIVVRLERHPQHITRGQPFDWKAVISLPNGGLQGIRDQYPNEAPAEGYKPELVIDMPAESPEWHSSFRGNYYAKLRNGQAFARFVLTLTADSEPPPSRLTLEGYVNHAGNRNLEVDPDKELKAH